VPWRWEAKLTVDTDTGGQNTEWYGSSLYENKKMTANR